MAKRKPISGIYSITNIKNGKMYIGSSKDINQRLKAHYRELKKGKHINTYLQNSYNKYGRDCFKGKTILKCEESILYIEERKQIELHNTIDRRFGYNLELPSTELKGKYSKSAIKKLKEYYKSNKPANVKCSKKEWVAMVNSGYKRYRGKWITIEDYNKIIEKKSNKNNKSRTNLDGILSLHEIIIKIDFDGNYIDEFITYKEASNSVPNGRNSAIKNVLDYYDGITLKKSYKSYKGFIWMRRATYMTYGGIKFEKKKRVGKKCKLYYNEKVIDEYNSINALLAGSGLSRHQYIQLLENKSKKGLYVVFEENK